MVFLKPRGAEYVEEKLKEYGVELLSPAGGDLFGLKSANFTLTASDSGVTFCVLGYGHGVGMSQFGANYMAKNGEKYTEILSHYYTNIQIIKN